MQCVVFDGNRFLRACLASFPPIPFGLLSKGLLWVNGGGSRAAPFEELCWGVDGPELGSLAWK